MTIQQLQYFLEVYQTGSITQAARKLIVSQSSVSGALSALERELDCTLFLRGRRGVTLTPHGMRVLEHARRVCESCRIIARGAASNRQVRICSNPYPSYHTAFQRLIAEYGDRTDISFSLLSAPLADLIERLSLFDQDLGLNMILDDALPGVEATLHAKGLRWREIRTVPFVIRLGPGHRLYRQASVTPEDLAGDRVVDVFHGGTVFNDFVKKRLRIDPDRFLPVSDSSARFALVEAGLAYGIGPKLPDRTDARYGFRNIPVEGGAYHLLAISPNGRPSPEADRFLALLKEELADV